VYFAAFLRRRVVGARHDHERRARVSEVPSARLPGRAGLLGTRICQVRRRRSHAASQAEEVKRFLDVRYLIRCRVFAPLFIMTTLLRFYQTELQLLRFYVGDADDALH